MGGLSIWHWIIIIIAVVLIFGTKKLKNIGTDLGEAVKGFKEGVKSGGESGSAAAAPVPPSQQVSQQQRAADPNTVDVEAKTKS